MKRTPQLSFQVDPAVDHGELVEEILRELRSSGELREGSSSEPALVEEAEDLAGGPAGLSGDDTGGEAEAGGAAGTSAEPAV
jgi:hypothetical protein